ncbi:MAG: hypothetical protein IPK98_16205 [Chloracidobacterium sp.]|nr:hypothetical protein [Chloracidobacterium sp.]
MPVNAVINIKGQETTTVIDTVRKASVKTIGGSINLRNIAEGAVAVTYEGDVTVEDSDGRDDAGKYKRQCYRLWLRAE